MSGITVCNNFCVVPCHEQQQQQKRHSVQVYKIFHQCLQLQKREDKEVWAKLRNVGAYITNSKPLHAPAQTGFQSSAIITLNLGLPYI